MLENMEDILSRSISGFHQYILMDPVRLRYASRSLCEMTGFTERELVSATEDLYAARIEPADRPIYEAFLHALMETSPGHACSCQYRIIKKNRAVLFVNDTTTVRRLENGILVGDSVLSDITDLKNENLLLKDIFATMHEVVEQQEARLTFEPDHKPAPLPPAKRVHIRTFGYFDVFVGDQPIAFRNEKSKELFALLVDRLGGFVSSEEAISFLWEDEPVSPITLARYRKVALRLKNILEEYGISDIVESVNGKRRLVADKVQCDLYDYLSGREEATSLFKGSYLTNYSWGENTLGELMHSSSH